MDICVSTLPFPGIPSGRTTSKAYILSVATSSRCSPRSYIFLTLPLLTKVISENSVFKITLFTQNLYKRWNSSGFLARLCKKGCKFFLYIITLTVRTLNLGLCFKFLDRKKNCKLFFAVFAGIFICRHNYLLLNFLSY